MEIKKIESCQVKVGLISLGFHHLKWRHESEFHFTKERLSTWGQDLLLLWRSGIALDWVREKNIWKSQLGIDAGLVLALDNIKSSVRSTIKRNSSRQVSTCVCPQDTVLLPRRLAENCPWPAENARPADNFLIQRGPRTSPCLPGPFSAFQKYQPGQPCVPCFPSALCVPCV